MPGSYYRKAVVLNLSASLVWAFTAVLIRYISAGFPVLFQSFVRYLSAIIILWPLYFSSTGSRERTQLRLNLRRVLPRVAMIGIANYAFQVSYTAALYRVYPGLAMLIYQSTALFSVLLGSIFFRDERSMLKRPLFYVSLACAVSGVVMTISPGNAGGSAAPFLGVVFVLISALSWAVLSTMVRAWLPGQSPYFINAAVFTFVTPLFLLSHFALQGPQLYFQASGWLWLVMILSGLVGIGLGHSLFYRSVPVLGVALSNILQLTRPFFAGLFSFLIFGERLSPLQITGGLLLIGGAYAVTMLRETKEVR